MIGRPAQASLDRGETAQAGSFKEEDALQQLGRSLVVVPSEAGASASMSCAASLRKPHRGGTGASKRRCCFDDRRFERSS